MNKKIIAIEKAPKAVGPYSQGIMMTGQSNIYYFSGMLPIDPATGVMAEADAAAQTRQILKNIGNLLSSENMSAANVIKTTVFLTDMQNFSAMNGEYSQFFSSEPPARSCVEVSKLPLGAIVEIEVIAAK